MNAKSQRASAAMSSGYSAPPTEIPTDGPAPKKRRTPEQAQRERLEERIRKLEADRDAAVVAAIEEINENAENDRKERIARASARVTARYAERIDVQRKMLSALAPKEGK